MLLLYNQCTNFNLSSTTFRCHFIAAELLPAFCNCCHINRVWILSITQIGQECQPITMPLEFVRKPCQADKSSD